jgi:chromosome partitioning protein
MKILATLNAKGGVGKTTYSVNYACWCASQGLKTLLVDADSQGSSKAWMERLGGAIPCISLTTPDEVLDRLKSEGADFDRVVVDAPAGDSETTRAVLLLCDLVVMPVHPTGLDLNATGKTLRAITQIQAVRNGLPRSCCYLSRVRPGAILAREARELLTGKVVMLDQEIQQREAIADLFGQGLTVFSAKGRASTSARNQFSALFTQVEAQEV